LPPASAPAVVSRVPVPMDGSYLLPPPDLLEAPVPVPIQDHESKINSRAMLLEKTLLEHGCTVRVVQIDTGPVITQFEIELEAGLRVSKVSGLANDLAIALAVPSVRIVAPIPGKTTVGIEVPNDRRGIVRLSEVVTGTGARLDKMRIPLFLGKDVKGQALAFDLAEMPHLLIAGRTGTGKSVCLNAMILSILMTRRPDECKLILIDPKKVELSQFKRIPHLMHPVITDEKKAESLLSWACDKMDERYGYLARAEVRNIQGYNALGPDEIYNRLRPEDDEERARIPTYMPSIVIIIDEMGDLIAQVGKEIETHIIRLAQKARAAGIHLILATQKPTVDVITGLIKSNLPARIAFQVSSRNDSRVVLDEMGADKLLGNGDMLFLIPGTSHLVRAQGTYISDAEVQRVCQYLEQYPVEFSKELVQLQVNGALNSKDRASALKDRDEMYEAAIEIVIREQRGSTSLLQRALGIGYGRAARLIDFMAEDGIVGEFKSGSAREVLYTWDDWEALKNGGDDTGAAA
ncbi:MAG TPA: DNA translocase FtsK, partial [Isosphaeraceae bacterium]|nr:DNA translocase FtsK [Isosphaeraceae bacterium]